MMIDLHERAQLDNRCNAGNKRWNERSAAGEKIWRCYCSRMATIGVDEMEDLKVMEMNNQAWRWPPMCKMILCMWRLPWSCLKMILDMYDDAVYVMPDMTMLEDDPWYIWWCSVCDAWHDHAWRWPWCEWWRCMWCLPWLCLKMTLMYMMWR